ncbi:MAG: ATP-binding cassette domain-containing protein [Butyrivibrio sp.]|nr:ATP-binding cassette domain-containing protein [Butyrivibrio sp.]
MLNWFDKQIRTRKESDQELFEDSIIQIAAVVMGGKAADEINEERLITKSAIDDILKYYHYKPSNIPDSVKGLEEQMEWAFRPHGIMKREVKLTEGWYKNAFGPMIAFTKEEERPVALLPDEFGGYYIKDHSRGKKIRINKENAGQLSVPGICFYRPLPLKKIGIPDLIYYLKDCIELSDYAGVIVASLGVTLLGLISPRLSKVLTGTVRMSGSTSLLVGISLFMLCTAVTSQLVSAIKQILLKRIEHKTKVQVEAAVMMRTISLPAEFFRTFGAGNLSERASAISTLCNMIIGDIFSLGLTSILSILYIFQIASLAPGLAEPAIVIILITVVVGVVTSVMQIQVSRGRMQLSVQESGMKYAIISGIQKIKLSGAEKRAFAKWARLYARVCEFQYSPPMFLRINSVIMTAISLFGNIILYFLAVKENIGVSGYYAFSISYGQVMGAFSALAGITLSVAQIAPILEIAEPILKAEPEVTEGREIVSKLSGTIELNNVSFRYNEQMPYVINDLSLKIRAGEYVAIVGKTGCGKSTLMRLLLGFEKPTKGTIYYDSRDINKLDLKSLRRKVGAVMQSGGLFQGDIFSNISISAPSMTLKDAWDAAEIAGIAGDIRNMPMGMHTLISEGQGGISGGQRQRIMIARAVAPKPKILMFDEATSALDNKTQKKVAKALDELNCTRIVIAHRLSTIRNCDRILVLDGGRIIEEGSYDQLIEKGGYFASLVARQRIDLKEKSS